MASGIYAIFNTVNKKLYIGSALYLKKREQSHFSSLRLNKHYNKYLQSAFNKYGEEKLIFRVLEFVVYHFDLIKREQWYINIYRSYDRTYGYNLSPTAGSPLGIKHTDETKAKVSKFHKNRKHSEEHTIKISLALTGKKASDKTRINISKGLTGRKLSITHIANRSAGQMKREKWPHGWQCVCESCKKLRSKYRKDYAIRKANSNG